MLRLKCGVAVRYGDVQSGSPHKVTAFVAVLPHSCGDRTTGQSSALARGDTETRGGRNGSAIGCKHPVRFGVRYTYIERNTVNMQREHPF